MKTLIFITYFFFFVSLNLKSQVVFVPADYPDIQTAVDNVSNNDTIVLSDNEYIENVIINKPITLASNFIFSGNISNVENTIINGNENGTTVTIQNISSDTLRFIGITVTGGSGTLADPQNFGIEMLHGGGFFIHNVHAVVIEASVINENKILTEHNSAGGILCNNSSLVINNSEISDNLINGGSFLGEGAGLYLLESDCKINESLFTNNISSVAYGEGGAIYAKNSTVFIQNSDFTANENINGGAMYFYDTDLELSNANISENFGMQASGIYFYNTVMKACNFTNVTLSGNSSLSNNSSGVLSMFSVNGTIKNSFIIGNESGLGCGGISISHSDMLIDNTEISENSASSGIGGDAGGIKIYQSNVEIRNSLIENNQCLPDQLYNKGGGIKVTNSNLVLDSVIISGNLGGQGGAIFSILSNITLKRTLVDNNSGEQGGAIYSYGSTINLLSSTFADNYAPFGSAVHSQHSDLLSVNSILWNDGPYELYFRQDTDTSEYNFAYSAVREGENSFFTSGTTEINWLEGNIEDEPVFSDGGEYFLQDESPLIDLGTARYEFNGTPVIDYSEYMYFGTDPDIGAFENWNDQSSVQSFGETLLVLYPNPSSKFINIETHSLNKEFIVSVYTFLGERVISAKNQTQIDISMLASGIYFVKMETGGETQTGKIIKTN